MIIMCDKTIQCFDTKHFGFESGLESEKVFIELEFKCLLMIHFQAIAWRGNSFIFNENNGKIPTRQKKKQENKTIFMKKNKNSSGYAKNKCEI